MGKLNYYIGGQGQDIRRALGDISKYSAKVQAGVRQLVKKTAEDIAQDAKARAPMRTGKLRQWIRAEHYEDTSGRPESVVKTEVPYAHWVEFGAGPALVSPKKRLAMTVGGRYLRGVARIPSRPASPFMQPAYDAGAEKLLEEVKELVKK